MLFSGVYISLLCACYDKCESISVVRDDIFNSILACLFCSAAGAEIMIPPISPPN